MYTGECIREKCILENMYWGVYTGECIIRDFILENAKWSVCTGECVMENVCWRVYTEEHTLIEYIYWRRVCWRVYNGECIIESV